MALEPLQITARARLDLRLARGALAVAAAPAEEAAVEAGAGVLAGQTALALEVVARALEPTADQVVAQRQGEAAVVLSRLAGVAPQTMEARAEAEASDKAVKGRRLQPYQQAPTRKTARPLSFHGLI